MIKLFNLFVKDQKINDLTNPSNLSRKFNAWIIALGNARNKTIVNEANKFMIRKWIENGKVSLLK